MQAQLSDRAGYPRRLYTLDLEPRGFPDFFLHPIIPGISLGLSNISEILPSHALTLLLLDDQVCLKKDIKAIYIAAQKANPIGGGLLTRSLVTTLQMRRGDATALCRSGKGISMPCRFTY